MMVSSISIWGNHLHEYFLFSTFDNQNLMIFYEFRIFERGYDYFALTKIEDTSDSDTL